MTLPTIETMLGFAKGLEATPLELLKTVWPVWDGFARAGRAWRLGYKVQLEGELHIEWLRGDEKPNAPYNNLPGDIYAFPDGKKALEWRDACIAKLERHLNKRKAA
jgi:hypothetical protein